jgi:rhamnose utilization protein RhaD (predicted bifunctional aldolase and dehydrogenase)/NAD(P)-dependent dehydrogenase (short-subunit alcohol dehydrogenase family)
MAENLWRDDEAVGYEGDLALRVYSSRLLGRDPSLVLHGGGNTSVKIRETNLIGEEEDILYVKGSGWDLASIEQAGFTPVRMAHLVKLARLETLSDLQMVNELKTQQTVASAPTASVEAILHAVLPYKYVDHTHADAVVTLTNTPDAERRILTVYGDEVIVIPYVMPGFDLARLVAERYAAEAHPRTIGMVLMNHGIFSFGETAQESYERMIALVNRAEGYLKEQGAWDLPEPEADTDISEDYRWELAELRQKLSEATGRPMLMRIWQEVGDLAFANRDDLERITQQGPATPDHVIRTKRVPMLCTDITDYVTRYCDYFEKYAPQARTPVEMLDPAPRVVLDKDLGMLTLGKSAKECIISADIYRHTMEIILRAEALGGWQALSAQDIFNMEYWELEQAKLKQVGSDRPFQGEVALVSGAASGIGKACVDSLLARGAAVIGLDRDYAITNLYPERDDFLGLVCDVTDISAIRASLEQAVRHFGGLDMLLLNAGMFPGGQTISKLSDELWREVMTVNLDANLALMRECHLLLKLAARNGRVVIIGSKNVSAPGPGAAAYSASKAALTQLMRVAALEWGGEGIRINELHPDAVFDTGIWTEEVVQARADHYSLTVEEYKTKNILKTVILSHDVAELAAEMCGPLFDKTTAAQVPVDGGNDRVI